MTAPNVTAADAQDPTSKMGGAVAGASVPDLDTVIPRHNTRSRSSAAGAGAQRPRASSSRSPTCRSSGRPEQANRPRITVAEFVAGADARRAAAIRILSVANAFPDASATTKTEEGGNPPGFPWVSPLIPLASG